MVFVHQLHLISDSPRFERELEALRKELAETKSAAASQAASPSSTPGGLPSIHSEEPEPISSGVSVSSMDDALHSEESSPIIVGKAGHEMDLKDAFKLDATPTPDIEPKKDR